MKVVTVILLISLFSLSAFAADGAALFKTNCAMCHKADGSGNPAMKAPALNTDAIKKIDDAKLAETIAQQPKHTAKVKALSADDLKAIAGFVKTLK